MGKKEQFVIFDFGYRAKYAVPNNKVSALLELLSGCERVNDKYLDTVEGQIYYVEKDAYPITLTIPKHEIYPEEPFNPKKEEPAAEVA